MSHLIVIGFKNDPMKASKVLNKLLRMKRTLSVQLNDATAVYRNHNGELRVDKRYELITDEGALRGLILGAVVGALLTIPLADVTSSMVAATALTAGTVASGRAGAVAGALEVDWQKEGFGISDEFINDGGEILQPGDSAIFAVLHADDPDEILSHFEGMGGKVIATSLSDEQSTMIESILNGRRMGMTGTKK